MSTTIRITAKRRDVIRRNAAMLPAYSLVLGLIALFGYMARAVPAVNAGVKAGHGDAQLSVPLLFAHMFPNWFAGIGFSAIIIGALVPAAVMSIAAANLFTRTLYKELISPYATPAQETRVARLASLLMKVGALGFALELNKTFSINLQLLGGIWILQTFPSVVIGLYTPWFHRFSLIIGWAAGMAYRTIQAHRTPGGGQAHFGGSAAPVFGHITYIAITALIINVAVSAVLTLLFENNTHPVRAPVLRTIVAVQRPTLVDAVLSSARVPTRTRISRRCREPIGGRGSSHPMAGPPTRQRWPGRDGEFGVSA